MKHERKRVIVTTHPSLALIKYWGKKPNWFHSNIPATSSIAVNLSNCNTRITLESAHNAISKDIIYNKKQQLSDEIYYTSYAPFLQYLKHALGISHHFRITIDNDFPIAAGVASSSSIFAGITIAVATSAGYSKSAAELSSLARRGSTSAARSIYGSWTVLKRGHKYAKELQVPSFWDNMRVVVVITSSKAKAISSRLAMKLCQTNSFAYRNWVQLSKQLFRSACTAINQCDFDTLGILMQQSYCGMIATMLSCQSPIRYLNHDSVRLLDMCKKLRAEGVLAWETMDAGPQVKIFTNAEHRNAIIQAIQASDIDGTIIDSAIGGAPRIECA